MIIFVREFLLFAAATLVFVLMASVTVAIMLKGYDAPRRILKFHWRDAMVLLIFAEIFAYVAVTVRIFS